MGRSRFNIDRKVLDLSLKSPMENLEDFRFYFISEDQIDSSVAQDAELKDANLRIQMARTRRARSAVRQSALRREAGKSSSSVVVLDDLLEEATLREAKVNFWMRYRLRYPAEIMPADAMVSCCCKT